MSLFKKYRLGLALSGGGIRGFSHIGALKALEEHDLKPDVISGVSAGAVVGAFYADGFTPDEIHELLKDKDFFDISQVVFPKDGLLHFTGLRGNILSRLKSKSIEDLPLKLIVCATNLNRAETTYFENGNIEDIITASASIPALFSPTIINGEKYVDGGILDNLPVKPIRELSKKVIAINTNFLVDKKDFDTIPKIMERVLHIGVNKSVKESINMADHCIIFEELNQFSIFDTSKSDLMFKIGYDNTKKYLAENKL